MIMMADGGGDGYDGHSFQSRLFHKSAAALVSFCFEYFGFRVKQFPKKCVPPSFAPCLGSMKA